LQETPFFQTQVESSTTRMVLAISSFPANVFAPFSASIDGTKEP
jgi:hypothetical protein